MWQQIGAKHTLMNNSHFSVGSPPACSWKSPTQCLKSAGHSTGLLKAVGSKPVCQVQHRQRYIISALLTEKSPLPLKLSAFLLPEHLGAGFTLKTLLLVFFTSPKPPPSPQKRMGRLKWIGLLESLFLPHDHAQVPAHRPPAELGSACACALPCHRCPGA